MLSSYIGVPFADREDTFKGADCFGLVRLFYREELGISLFKHTAKYDDIRKIVMEYLLQESSPHWVKNDKPQLHDVVVMARDPKHPKIIQHFGIMISSTKMLHTLDGVGSHISSIRQYKYCIKGFYRWLN